MTNKEDKLFTLIIHSDNKTPEFFLVPNEAISEDQKADLNWVCSMKLSHTLEDKEYDKILCIKASIADEDTFIPKDVPENWKYCFSKYKTNVPINAFEFKITSVILIN